MNKIFSIIKKTISFLFYLIIIPVVLYNLVIITETVIFKNDSPSFMDYNFYFIISGSMEPTINIGDMIIVKNNKEGYQENDIISYEENGSYVTHRIISIIEDNQNNRLYRTKGDANNTNDIEPVEEAKVKGKVIKILPKMGFPVIFFKQHSILIISIVIILYAVIEIIQKKEKNPKK